MYIVYQKQASLSIAQTLSHQHFKRSFVCILGKKIKQVYACSMRSFSL